MDLQKVTLPLLILDVEKNDTKQALAHVLNQHDAGYQQPFILNSGDDTYDAPAEDFHFRASRPDGQIIDVDNATGELVKKGDQNWILNIPNGVTETPGLVKCVIYVKDNSGQVLASSQQIVYNVIPAFDVDNVNHISYVNDLDKLKAKLTDIVGKAQEQINGLSGIITDKNQAADQKLKEELDKITQQAGDWLNGEKITIDSKIQAVIDKLNADKQASLQAINNDWAKQKTSLQADIAGFKDDLAKQIKSITDSVKALNTNDLPAIQAKVKGFGDALDNLNGQISAIKLDITGYAKTADVNKAIDTKADKSTLDNYALKKDVPSIAGLEKQADHANDIKNINETLETYALKKDVPSVAGLETTTEHKADVDALNKALANKADKTALDSYALKTDVPAAPDLTGYAKKSDLPPIPNLSIYAKVTDVANALNNKADKADLSAYETSTDHKSDIDKLNKALDGKANVSAIPTLPDMNKYALKTDLKNVDLTGYLTKDDTTRLLGEKANESELVNYAKKTDVSNAFQGAMKVAASANNTANMVFSHSVHGIQVDGGAPVNKDKYGWVNLPLGLSDYIKKADADNEYAKKTDIPAIPDTSNFVTNSNLTSELSNYALKSDASTGSGATSIKAMKQMAIDSSNNLDTNNPSNYSTYLVDNKTGQINMAVDPNSVIRLAPAGAFPCVANAVLDPKNTYSDDINASSLADYYPSYIFKFPDGKYYLNGQQLMFSSDIPGGGKLVSQISIEQGANGGWSSLSPDSYGNLSIPTDSSAIFPSVLRAQNPDSSTLDKMKNESKKDGFFYVGGDEFGHDHLVAAGYELVKKEDLDALTARVAALEAKLSK